MWKELLRTFSHSHGGAAGWREGCADEKVHEAWDSAWKKRDRGGKETMQIR